MTSFLIFFFLYQYSEVLNRDGIYKESFEINIFFSVLALVSVKKLRCNEFGTTSELSEHGPISGTRGFISLNEVH
jgi:hypothetical protein